MKTLLRTLLVQSLLCAISFPALAADSSKSGAADSFKDDKDKASYGIGMYFGNQIKRNNLDVNIDTVIGAMKDVLAGNPPKMNDMQAGEAIRNYQQAQRAKAAEKNKKEAEEFLDANKKKPGVKTKEVSLPDGKTAELQYKVIKEGTGEIPKPTDTVEVNYKGTFINGKEFDSSAKHGPKPAEFPVGGVVKGWTEALEMMKVGSKWEVYLPPTLAYGDRGAPPNIEPGTALIFEMELVGIKPPPPPPAPAQPLTSDIIRVPSADELKKGEKIQVLKPEDVERLKKEQEQKDKKP